MLTLHSYLFALNDVTRVGAGTIYPPGATLPAGAANSQNTEVTVIDCVTGAFVDSILRVTTSFNGDSDGFSNSSTGIALSADKKTLYGAVWLQAFVSNTFASHGVYVAGSGYSAVTLSVVDAQTLAVKVSAVLPTIAHSRHVYQGGQNPRGAYLPGIDAAVGTTPSFLSSCILPSADGSRVYLIGSDPGTNKDASTGTWLYVYDVGSQSCVHALIDSTLANTYTSVLESSDGRYLYVFGVKTTNQGYTTLPVVLQVDVLIPSDPIVTALDFGVSADTTYAPDTRFVWGTSPVAYAVNNGSAAGGAGGSAVSAGLLAFDTSALSASRTPLASATPGAGYAGIAASPDKSALSLAFLQAGTGTALSNGNTLSEGVHVALSAGKPALTPNALSYFLTGNNPNTLDYSPGGDTLYLCTGEQSFGATLPRITACDPLTFAAVRTLTTLGTPSWVLAGVPFSETTPLTVPLTVPTGDLAGEVTGGTTFRSLDGATVALYTGRDTQSAAGQYEIDHIPIGAYDVLAYAPAFVPQFQSATVIANQQSTQNFNLELCCVGCGNGYLFGWVTDSATGLPVPYGVVSATLTEALSAASTSPVGTVYPVTAGFGGGWVLSLPAGTYSLAVQEPGGASSPAGLFTVTECSLTFAGAIPAPPLPCGTFTTVLGFAEDCATHQPALGVSVSIVGNAAFGDTTGTDGAYQLDGLPAGTVTVYAETPGYRPRRCVLSLAAGTPAQVDLGMVASDQPVGSLSGYVTTQANSPVTGAIVRVPGVVQTVTNGAGYWRLDDLLAGACSVQVLSPGHPPAQAAATVIAGAATAVSAIVLPPGSPLTVYLAGLVRSLDTLLPLPGATLAATDSTVTVGTDGAYIAAVPGAASVIASANGVAPKNLALDPSLAGLITDLNIGMESLSTPLLPLSGYIVDAGSNAPLPGARVTAGRFREGVSLSPDGAYSLPVPAGAAVTGTAMTSGKMPLSYAGVRLTTPLSCDFGLPAFSLACSLATLTVTVVEAGSRRPLSGAAVSLTAGRPALLTNRNGQVTLAALPAGNYTASAALPGYRVGFRSATLSEGNNFLYLTLAGFPADTGQIYGYVSAAGRPIGENAVGGCGVLTTPAYDGSIVLTDANGFYLLDTVPASALGTPYAVTFDDPAYDLLTERVTDYSQLAVRLDAVLSLWDGRLPAGWTVIVTNAAPLSRPVETAVVALNNNSAATELRRLDTLVLTCGLDTRDLSRYRRAAYDRRSSIAPVGSLLFRAAIALAPGVQIKGFCGVGIAPAPIL